MDQHPFPVFLSYLNRMVSSRRNKNKTRNQRGGDGYGYNGSVIASRGGIAPMDLHTPYSTCAPAQRGGGCGCGIQLQSGGGSDGFYSNVSDNLLGKVPVYGINPCVQRGGNAAQQYGVSSYNAGYGFYPIEGGAAGVPFMATVPYGNSCKGGYRKKRRNTRGRKTRNRK
jgi:hypothetical protein